LKPFETARLDLALRARVLADRAATALSYCALGVSDKACADALAAVRDCFPVVRKPLSLGAGSVMRGGTFTCPSTTRGPPADSPPFKPQELSLFESARTFKQPVQTVFQPLSNCFKQQLQIVRTNEFGGLSI
jgi:hypothetical protein